MLCVQLSNPAGILNNEREKYKMYLLPFIFSYLIGTISPGFFITKFYKHMDIRKFGAKYTGAANVYKIAGFIPAILTGLIDFTKGVIAISSSFLFWKYITPKWYNGYFLLLAAIFTILGHIFPFYLNFKGGRGAATSYGVLLVSLLLLIHVGYPLLPVLWLVFYTLVLFFILHSFSFSGFLIDVAAFIVFYIYYLRVGYFKQSLMVNPNILFLILETSLGIIILSSIYTYSKRKSLGIKLKEVKDSMVKQRVIFYFYLLITSLLPFFLNNFIIILTLGILLIISLPFVIKYRKRAFVMSSFLWTVGLILLSFLFKSKYTLITGFSFAMGYISSDLINRYSGIIHIFKLKRSVESVIAFFAFALLGAFSINTIYGINVLTLIWASLVSSALFYTLDNQFNFLLTPILFGVFISFL